MDIHNYTKINVNDINKLKNNYPEEFICFCSTHNLKIPNINSGKGKVLSAMLYYPNKYWTRDDCEL